MSSTVMIDFLNSLEWWQLLLLIFGTALILTLVLYFLYPYYFNQLDKKEKVGA